MLCIFKTQNYHWNVEETSFQELYLLLEERQSARSCDTVAEFIRGLSEKILETAQKVSDIDTQKKFITHVSLSRVSDV